LGLDVLRQDLSDLERVGIDGRPGVFQRDARLLRNGLGVLVRILLGPSEDARDPSEDIRERGPPVRVVERFVSCPVVVVDLIDRRNALGDDAGTILAAIADGGFQIDQASTLPELNAEAPAAGLR
jgi:hypothetical protein